MKEERGKRKYLLTVFAAALAIVPERAFAAEGAICPPKRAEENIVSVELPVQDENEGYPFDFILDPQGLLYETDAMRYGGGTVEEGAALLFRNREGEYDFSGTSDRLTVTNRGSGSVRITVSAQVSGLGEMSLQEDADFCDSQACSIYLALTDSEGHVQPLCAGEEVLITYEMDSGTYSFGLSGACNSNADWEHMSVYPVVTVTWIVEPMEVQHKEMPGEETGGIRQESRDPQEKTPESKGKYAEEESCTQETGPGSENADIGEDNASQQGDAPEKEDADIGEDNAGEPEDSSESGGVHIEEGNTREPEDSSESGGADIDEDNAGEPEDSSESGGADIDEDDAGEPKDAAESGETDIEEGNAEEREDATESGVADIDGDNTGEQVNPSESWQAETEMTTPATEESEAESVEADAGKGSAAAPASESGDSGTETECERAESEDKT